MPRFLTVALIEDPDAEAAAFAGIGPSTVVLGLPSVPFAVDVVQLLLLASRQVREFGRVDGGDARSPPGPVENRMPRRSGCMLHPARIGASQLCCARECRTKLAHRFTELGISQSTVKAHLRNVMMLMKLKAKNRTEAAQRASAQEA